MEMEVDKSLDEDEGNGSENKGINLRGYHRCEECNVLFSVKKSFNRHMKYKHKNDNINFGGLKKYTKNFHCDRCDITYTNYKEYCVHKLLHNEENCCTACNVKFKTDLEFRTHVNDHLKAKTYTCVECGNCFEKIGLLIKDDKTFKCDNCYQEQVDLKVDKSNALICRLCEAIYGSTTALRRHTIKRHNTDKIFKCKDCLEAFLNKPELLSHTNNIHKPKNLFDETLHIEETTHNFDCRECDKKFPSQRNLDVHKLLHNNNDFKCTVCNKEEKDHKSFEKHILKHLEFYCKLCPKMFLKLTALQNHVNVHTNERPYKCTKCGKSYKQTGALHYHMTTHDANKKSACFTCDICNCACANSSSLKRHMKHMHAEKQENEDSDEAKPPLKKIQYTCNICENSKFDTKELLRNHIMSSHNVITKVDDKVMCIICTSFFAPEELEQHKSMHFEFDVNKYVCLVCSKLYFNKPDIDFHMDAEHYSQIFCSDCEQAVTYFNYKKHMRKHETVNCKICGELLFSKRSYIIHLKSHEIKTEEVTKTKTFTVKTTKYNKPSNGFTCKTCNTVFILKRNYENHLKINTCIAYKDWTCKVCGMNHSSRYTYELHKLVHTDEKRFVCRFCFNIKYKTPGYLVRHFKKYHGGKPAMFCSSCNEEFRFLSQLQRHTKKKHGVAGVFSIYKEGESICFDTEDKPKKQSDDSETDVKNEEKYLNFEENEVKPEYVETINYELDIVKREDN